MIRDGFVDAIAYNDVNILQRQHDTPEDLTSYICSPPRDAAERLQSSNSEPYTGSGPKESICQEVPRTSSQPLSHITVIERRWRGAILDSNLGARTKSVL